MQYFVFSFIFSKLELFGVTLLNLLVGVTSTNQFKCRGILEALDYQNGVRCRHSLRRPRQGMGSLTHKL